LTCSSRTSLSSSVTERVGQVLDPLAGVGVRGVRYAELVVDGHAREFTDRRSCRRPRFGYLLTNSSTVMSSSAPRSRESRWRRTCPSVRRRRCSARRDRIGRIDVRVDPDLGRRGGDRSRSGRPGRLRRLSADRTPQFGADDAAPPVHVPTVQRREPRQLLRVRRPGGGCSSCCRSNSRSPPATPHSPPDWPYCR
jgi:hypothetical protein